MRAEVKWTNLSRGQISRRLDKLGTPASRQVVSQLLRKNGYRRRKALKKKTMGPRNPNRNAQFKKIARLKKQYLKAGLPIISMDTKKKELLGNFYRDGKIDTQETIETNDPRLRQRRGGNGDPPWSLRCGEEPSLRQPEHQP